MRDASERSRVRRAALRTDVRFRLMELMTKKKGKCKNTNIAWALTLDHLADVYSRQKGKCALTGRALAFASGNGHTNPDALSIDRIEGKLGYIIGNVRLVTLQANYARNGWSDAELVTFCQDVLKTAGAAERPPLAG